MRIGKKRSINYLKYFLKLRSYKRQNMVLFTISWTRLFRKNKLILGLSKSLVIKNKFIFNYLELPTYLSRWNNVHLNVGVNSKLNLYNKGISLDSSKLDKKFISVKDHWYSGRFYASKKSGSKNFAPWDSKLKPDNKMVIRDLVYLKSYTLYPYDYSNLLNLSSGISTVMPSTLITPVIKLTYTSANLIMHV